MKKNIFFTYSLSAVTVLFQRLSGFYFSPFIIDPDAEVFESRRNEDASPVEECEDILRRIERIKSSR